jgi:8-amino-7-oxononanoate synthase
MSAEAGKGRNVDALLSMMRQAPGAGQMRVEMPARNYDVSFETLPQYQQIKFQRDFAGMAGLDVPYYRLHAGRSAATAVIGNRELINFASYDYLGLNGHPEIVAAAEAATRAFGTSVSASRISAGERQVHRDLETLLATNYAAEDCIAFNSGHAGGVSTIAALMGPKDIIVHDALIHNCIVVGAQLSGATRRNFPHNDLEALDRLLTAERPRFERCLIATEGLFSMDGDGPDMARLVEIKRKHGAWLLMDDAHALGVLGARGRGIFEHQNVAPDGVDLWFGTLSKTLVGCGGYVAGSAVLVDLLKCHAPGFVYSVGMPASVAAASARAIEIMNAEPGRVARLQANSRRFLDRARQRGLDTGDAWGYAIIPVIVGETVRTLVLAERLREKGFNAFPILPPGVPEKSARLRFFLNATHSEAQIDDAVDAVAETLAEVRDVSAQSMLAELTARR